MHNHQPEMRVDRTYIYIQYIYKHIKSDVSEQSTCSSLLQISTPQSLHTNDLITTRNSLICIPSGRWSTPSCQPAQKTPSTVRGKSCVLIHEHVEGKSSPHPSLGVNEAVQAEMPRLQTHLHIRKFHVALWKPDPQWGLHVLVGLAPLYYKTALEYKLVCPIQARVSMCISH